MNRRWVIICKLRSLSEIAPLDRLWYAESNSPDEKLRLSGDPEIFEAVKIFLEMLPPTYTKEDAIELMKKAVEKVFI